MVNHIKSVSQLMECGSSAAAFPTSARLAPQPDQWGKWNASKGDLEPMGYSLSRTLPRPNWGPGNQS